MDIRGLVLVNSANAAQLDHDSLTNLPLALLEIAGKNPLERTTERLRRFGISPVTAVIEAGFPADLRRQRAPGGINCITATPDRFWRAAENAFNDMAQSGAELVILVRLGSYAEVDFERLVQFHLDGHSRVTQVATPSVKLETFCISASRRNDAASLFRSQLTRCRSECPLFEHAGYVNELAHPWDLRQFAIDVLMLRTETLPAGKEFRPGVWLAPGAMIEKCARILAPAFVGAMARVRSGAVITRCSSIESRAEVDCGTIVENSTVLPYSYVGAGLDLAHSVVGMGRIANLHRDAIVEIADPKLVRYVAATAGQKLLASAAELFTFVPRQIWQSVLGKYAPAPQPDLQNTIQQTPPSLGEAAGYQAPACDTEAAREFSSNLVIARRYGNE